jgi:ribose transport system substrate-binding protein
MAATVAQAPMNIGGYGVDNALKVKKGEKIDAVIDTGTVLVTKENADKYK